MAKSNFNTGIGAKMKNLFSSANLKLSSSKKSSSSSNSSASSGIVAKLSNSIISMLSEYSVQQEEVVGIDITPNSIKLAQLAKKDEKWIVEKLSYRKLDRIEDIKDFTECTELATKFLICGTVKAELPYDRVYKVREKNRRLGLGLMGMHEWLLQRKQPYKVTEEMHRWLHVYKSVSDKVAKESADTLGISRPVKVRAIAPTGSIEEPQKNTGLMSDTTQQIA